MKRIRRYTTGLALWQLIAACGNNTPHISPPVIVKEDSPKTNRQAQVTYLDIDSALEASLPWVDSVGEEYVKYSKNELVRNAVTGGYREEWLWDQLIIADSAKYLVLHIGHDFESRY